MKSIKIMSCILAAGMLFTSCNMSNTGKGALIGGGSGAAVGAGLGAIFGKGKGAAIGAAVGAAVGTTAGSPYRKENGQSGRTSQTGRRCTSRASYRQQWITSCKSDIRLGNPFLDKQFKPQFIG